ncbi:hypothetical protein AXE65_12335 [Ventosimonas gracilis]|uniref:Uncharacterized protein n=1 Tax=Ventosimonas gracilis TaxID=1680762 RepID=A0A139SVS9_9GAMM|nr:DUF3168 domain-containing protein [Ventosimonas gracilis]KXU38707.1 hypothetical protein AXE65_12335 [Ventosimonas gracilis]
MHAPLFELCKDQPELQAHLGNNPFRLYPFGNAPRNIEAPYAVWQRIGGAPEVALNGQLAYQQTDIQLDIYTKSLPLTRTIAQLFFNQLYNKAQIIRYGFEAFEPEAKLWRSSMDLRFMRT